VEPVAHVEPVAVNGQRLVAQGFEARYLEDGIEGWREAGLPMAAKPKTSTLWVTRERPKIDRIACPWLIRRFVDPAARFLFVAPSEVAGVADRFNATPFDIEGVFWTHRDDRCTFDVMVQEFGRYFDMPTACFRGGTLTGPNHSAAELHGFLAYVMRCTMSGTHYNVFGYGGKQVRDAIHSSDLIACFERVWRAPRVAEVYNIGGGRFSNCSVLEAIDLCQEITGKELAWDYVEQNRIGDHIWWIGDNDRFAQHYPGWELKFDVPAILREMYELNTERWT
jgi:nucleoside-diphosphate-sugar epimerase